MTLALMIVVTAIMAVLSGVFIVLYLSHRKTDSSYAALFLVFLVATVFSGIVLALYCGDKHELSLSDVLSFYGTIASVLASAYLGYVVYKIERDESRRNNSSCCIINKINWSESKSVTEPVLEVRWVTNDLSEKVTEGADKLCETLVFPEALQKPLVIIGRGYAKIGEAKLEEEMHNRIQKHQLSKQPPVLLFSIENHGPAFLQNVKFAFDEKTQFSTALVMSSTPDHKCKWLFLPGTFEDGQKVSVTFTSCYGIRTYADLKLVDLCPDTTPGLYFSCKHYHYHGSKKPSGFID
jgi:hypothetical protein